MVTKEQLDYVMCQIRLNGGLFQISDESLAEEMLPLIRKIMPKAQLVKCVESQWYAEDIKAVRKLGEKFDTMRNNLDYIMCQIRLNCGLCQMSDAALSEEMLPHIRQIIPEVQFIKFGIYQWYAVGPVAVKRLEEMLISIKSQRVKELDFM